MTSLHIVAINTLQDHEAGLSVPAHKLEAARKLLGRPISMPNAAAAAQEAA